MIIREINEGYSENKLNEFIDKDIKSYVDTVISKKDLKNIYNWYNKYYKYCIKEKEEMATPDGGWYIYKFTNKYDHKKYQFVLSYKDEDGKVKDDLRLALTHGEYTNQINPYVYGGSFVIAKGKKDDVNRLIPCLLSKEDEEQLLGENMFIRETWLDDEEYLDAGDTVYEAKAYYDKSHRSLAKSEEFPNAYELDEWVWDMCQQGYYVEVYDYEDEEYYYYRWPDNAEYMELYEPQDLETDERGNFLYIKDEGLK